MTLAAIAPSFRASSGPGIPECFIANARPGQDVLVAVHGVSRNAAEIAMRFATHPSFAQTTIVAPVFTRGAFGKYQQLAARGPDQTPADLALIALIEALAPEHGVSAERLRLFGFSGGAQMAHRFAMFHPARIARLCLVSAGWYCLPRVDLVWPYGIGDEAGAPVVGAGFLDIPTTVIVGNRDTRIDANLRQDPIIVEHQGRNRLRRARNYVAALIAHAQREGIANRPRLLTLPGMSHDFAQCVREGGLLDHAAEALL